MKKPYSFDKSQVKSVTRTKILTVAVASSFMITGCVDADTTSFADPADYDTTAYDTVSGGGPVDPYDFGYNDPIDADTTSFAD